MAGVPIALLVILIILFLIFQYWYISLPLLILLIFWGWALAEKKKQSHAVAAREWLNTAVQKKRIKVESKARAAFLEALVGLTPLECEEIAFDGENFHLRDLLPLDKLTSVTSSDSQYVRVADASLPHEVTYTYTRKDGGPDLRYSQNPKVMFAWRTVLTFSVLIGTIGGEQIVKVFRKGSSPEGHLFTASGTAKKINQLILLRKNPSFYGSQKLFEAEYDAIESANKEIARLERSVTEVSDAIAALQRLQRDKKVGEEESRSNLTILSRDLDKQTVDLSKLKDRKADADQAMRSISLSLGSYSDYKEDLARVAKVGIAIR